MTPRTRPIDLLAAVAALLTAAMLVAYLVIMASQDNSPALWVVVVLAVTALLAAYGATRRRGHRALLVVDGVLLGVLGLLAILTIGFPLLLASALCFAAVLRDRDRDRSPVAAHDTEAPLA